MEESLTKQMRALAEFEMGLHGVEAPLKELAEHPSSSIGRKIV